MPLVQQSKNVDKKLVHPSQEKSQLKKLCNYHVSFEQFMNEFKGATVVGAGLIYHHYLKALRKHMSDDDGNYWKEELKSTLANDVMFHSKNQTNPQLILVETF